MNNVIVLTTGLSGSSLLVSLLEAAGYWTGDSTKWKTDYDTKENSELVDLNEELLQHFEFDYKHEFPADILEKVYSQNNADIARRMNEFIAKCDEHAPWVLKDPRLWVTIRFWDREVDLSKVKFLVLVRSDLQCWISLILKRHIQTLPHLRSYNGTVNSSILAFLDKAGHEYMTVSYDDLVLKPGRSIRKLNEFLGSNITVKDLANNYNGKLYRWPRGLRDLLLACLIFFKNWRDWA